MSRAHGRAEEISRGRQRWGSRPRTSSLLAEGSIPGRADEHVAEIDPRIMALTLARCPELKPTTSRPVRTNCPLATQVLSGGAVFPYNGDNQRFVRG